MAAIVSGHPFDTIKVRLQTQSTRYTRYTRSTRSTRYIWFNLPGIPGSIYQVYLVQSTRYIRSTRYTWFNLQGIILIIFMIKNLKENRRSDNYLKSFFLHKEIIHYSFKEVVFKRKGMQYVILRELQLYTFNQYQCKFEFAVLLYF